jgi:hypothetical protein
MLFGTREKFGIEAQYLETNGSFQYARLQVWVGGAPIGDWDDTSDLAASARRGRRFLKESTRRTRPDLDQLQASQVLHLLYGQYIGAEDWPDNWDTGPYMLNEIGDSSVRDKAVVLVVRRGNGWDRLILKTYRDESLKEIGLEPGVCDEVISAYCSWVETLPKHSA